MRVVLDTNAYIALMRGHAGVAALVRRATQVVFSAVVAGELIFGFRHGSRYGSNRKQLEAFLDNPYVAFLPVTLSTAERFGHIAARLRQKGTPIPSNDIWIAAQALEAGVDLITFDRHFEAVEGVILRDPAGPDGFE
jgi:tRNA(fMet)-specific endonuclease VapC